MASFKEHCADCKKELGDEFPKVHEWLDELWTLCGPDHRDVRHNNLGVEKIRQKWGDKAAKAAEIHIMKDCREIPNVESMNFKIRLSMKPQIEEAFRKEGY